MAAKIILVFSLSVLCFESLADACGHIHADADGHIHADAGGHIHADAGEKIHTEAAAPIHAGAGEKNPADARTQIHADAGAQNHTDSGEKIRADAGAQIHADAVEQIHLKVTPNQCYELVRLATAGDQVDMVELLLRQGCSVNRLPGSKSRDNTPLHIAVMNHNLEMVTMLLDYDADVNARARQSKKLDDSKGVAMCKYLLYADK